MHVGIVFPLGLYIYLCILELVFLADYKMLKKMKENNLRNVPKGGICVINECAFEHIAPLVQN